LYFKNSTFAEKMQMTISELIQRRRAVFPAAYNGKPVARETIMEVLNSANWAPTHKRTDPWRFHVFADVSREKLSSYLGDFYLKNTPEADYSEIKHKKAAENPMKAAAVIAIVMKKHADIPEWEEVAAVAMAVQNMWLTCASLGIGSFWATPKAALEAGDFLGLQADEKCLGFFYMGYSDEPLAAGTRKTDIQEKTTWH